MACPNVASMSSYDSCEQSDIPEGVRFDVAEGYEAKAVQIAFGGPAADAERFLLGAPFKRVQNVETGRLQFFRLGAAQDRSRIAFRAFEGAKAQDSEKLNQRRAAKSRRR